MRMPNKDIQSRWPCCCPEVTGDFNNSNTIKPDKSNFNKPTKKELIFKF